MKHLHMACLGTENVANRDAIGRVADAERTVRPATARREENLRALVAELSSREMGYVGVAAHLHCSASCARHYVGQLLDLGVIETSPNKPAAGAADRSVFRLNRVLASSGRCGSDRKHSYRDPLVAALFGSPQGGNAAERHD